MEIKLKISKEHQGKYKNKKEHINTTCYTKKQIKEKFKDKQFKYAGEIGTKNGTCIGMADLEGTKIPVYKAGAHNKITEDIKGYIETSNRKYLAVVKNVLLSRILIILLIIFMPFVIIEDARNFVLDSIANMIENINNSSKNKPKPDIDSNAEDWKGNLPEDQNPNGQTKGIKIPGYKTIKLKQGLTAQRVSLVNPEGNPCYFVISFVLKDTNEVIYKSKMVPPGKGIYNITLNRKLTPGTYKMVLKYETFSLDGLNPMNGANVNVDLVVN